MLRLHWAGKFGCRKRRSYNFEKYNFIIDYFTAISVSYPLGPICMGLQYTMSFFAVRSAKKAAPRRYFHDLLPCSLADIQFNTVGAIDSVTVKPLKHESFNLC